MSWGRCTRVANQHEAHDSVISPGVQKLKFLVASLWGLAAVALASAVDRTLHDDDRLNNLEVFNAW